MVPCFTGGNTGKLNLSKRCGRTGKKQEKKGENFMKKIIALGLAAAMTTSLLAGCSSSSGSGDTGTQAQESGQTQDSSQSQEETAAEGETIRIGAIAPVTGDKAEAGQSVWKTDRNCTGGFQGGCKGSCGIDKKAG